MRTVKLALPINFRAIIKLVCDLAQKECEASKDIKNYYSLIILMAGVIDDF